jgi:Family of unknown function (DUF5681)
MQAARRCLCLFGPVYIRDGGPPASCAVARNSTSFKPGQSGNPKGRGAGKRGKIYWLTEQAKQELAEKHDTMPLDFLLSVLRDDTIPLDMRIQSATAAAPYMHRRMPIAIDGGDPSKPIVFEASVLHGLSVADKMVLLSLFEKMALGPPAEGS